MIVGGLLGIGGAVGIVQAANGPVPLLAGLFDYCVLVPLFGLPFAEPGIRSAVQRG